MKKIVLLLVLGTVVILFHSCETEIITLENETLNTEKINTVDEKSLSFREFFLVANRGSGTVSVFNAKNTKFITEITLPNQGAQPTYLAHSRRNNSVYVGDFANRKVVYYDANSFELQGEIEIEEGAFHMWINENVNQLWINNIISKSTSVIDLKSNTVLKNIQLPIDEIPELTENAEQHDVVISPSGYAAYVTL